VKHRGILSASATMHPQKEPEHTHKVCGINQLTTDVQSI